LIARSRDTRQRYIQLIRGAASDGPMRGKLQSANFAHGVSACGPEDKQSLRLMNAANGASVSSYIEMLAARLPEGHFPA
ncbi:phosphogluconate dehydratase, partial [Pseudomonas syringae pv. tagetis]